ncbi:MAG: dephospho-CoA kinase [Anaerolineae bacterium]|nr:dephospho-CoA kinase [Anaerolineae bacterium]
MRWVIGITGSMGTGKSTVLRMLEKLGAKAIDADLLVHRVMAKGTTVYEEVVEAFGEGVLGPKGEIDRKRLAALVFSDEEALKRLEAIIHPVVENLIWEIAEEAKEEVVAIEAIKLLEASTGRWWDALWVVTCRPEEQSERLLAQGLSEEEIEGRLKAQGPISEKIKAANVIIDNSGSLEETWEQVKREWAKIQEKGEGE